MQCLTTTECTDWLDAHGMGGFSPKTGPEDPIDGELLFAAPKEARTQANLARALVNWLGELDVLLLWITDWPFYKPDEMAIALGLRKAHGEDRLVIEAPGQVFSLHEQDELIGWVHLLMSYGWDGHLYPFPFCGALFQTSHEDILWAFTSGVERLRTCREIVDSYQLEVHRESRRC
ncbi:MAG: hypothetical protein EHM18_08910 [Acidobacteria bacterium]|nr:MAG: hypothetical protein EHM18_08910 [Acidobacteriota bacterium]